MVPVARCRLISAAFLAVPLLLWFRPWQYRLSAGPLVANQRAACTIAALMLSWPQPAHSVETLPS